MECALAPQKTVSFPPGLVGIDHGHVGRGSLTHTQHGRSIGQPDPEITGSAAARPTRSNPRPSAPQAAEPEEAIVKWFNAEKGFGFVAVVGGPEAFMHIWVLEAGHSGVPEGARVKVRIGHGLKGPQVSELIEVDTSSAPAASTTERRIHPRPGCFRPCDDARARRVERACRRSACEDANQSGSKRAGGRNIAGPLMVYPWST
jgi:cold shock CspA family protein